MPSRAISARALFAVWVGVGTTGGCASGVAPDGDDMGGTEAGWLAGPGEGGDAGTFDLGEVCGPWTLEHAPSSAETSVMFVLDKSGSMRESWDHDDDPMTSSVSRWWSLRTSMDRWVGSYGHRFEAGVQLFPRVGATSTVAQGCEMAASPEVPLGPLDLAALDPLPDAQTAMYGATPATLGVRAALDSLATRSASRQRALVLVTDGAANCREGTEGADLFNVFDELLEVEVERARQERSIPTYVVGIDIIDGPWTGPTVNPHVALSAVARAGGVARPGPVPYYAVSGPAQLDGALDQITAAVECGVPVPEGHVVAGAVTVTADGVTVSEVEACVDPAGHAVHQGWAWGSGADPSIELCGDTCRADSVTIEHRCE